MCSLIPSLARVLRCRNTYSKYVEYRRLLEFREFRRKQKLVRACVGNAAIACVFVLPRVRHSQACVCCCCVLRPASLSARSASCCFGAPDSRSCSPDCLGRRTLSLSPFVRLQEKEQAKARKERDRIKLKYK